MNLKIVTVATKRDGYLKYLEESCIRNSTELIILGMESVWTSYFDKYEILYQNLNQFDPNDILCLVDAYDVIMIDNAEKLKNKFIDFVSIHGRKIIMAHETFDDVKINGSNIPIVCDVFSFLLNTTFSDFKGVNPGTTLGFVSDIKIMIEQLRKYKDTINDDQIIVNKYIKEYPDVIHDDINREFFSLSYEILDLPEFDNISGFFIHRPGNLPFGEFLRNNGYDITTKEEVDILQTGISKIVGKSQYYIKMIR